MKLELKMALEQPELVTMADAAKHYGQTKNNLAGIVNKKKAGPNVPKCIGKYSEGGHDPKYYNKEDLYDYIDAYYRQVANNKMGQINRPDLISPAQIVARLGCKSTTVGGIHFFFHQYSSFFKSVKKEQVYRRTYYKRDQATAVIDAINKAKSDHAKVCTNYKQRGNWKELVKIPKNEMQSLSFDFLTRRMKLKNI